VRPGVAADLIRPVITGFAFSLGLVPLAIAEGAGTASRLVGGTARGGMFGTFVISMLT